MSDDLVRVAILDHLEAEIAAGLLRSEGIGCLVRPTDMAAGRGDGIPWSFQELLVRAADAAAARDLLAPEDRGEDDSPERISAEPG